jgi:hypothetical protein
LDQKLVHAPHWTLHGLRRGVSPAVEQHGAGELPTGLEHRVLVGAAK